MMERGEPKSGTGFMFDWAAGSMINACNYLEESFGKDTCTLDLGFLKGNVSFLESCTLTFQPQKVSDGAVCGCEDIERCVEGSSTIWT